MSAVSLALLLGWGLIAARQAGDQDVRTNSDGKKCGLEGTATSDAGKALDRLKNRYKAPATDDVDAEAVLAAMLAPGDDIDRFDEKKAAKVTGFVIGVKVGGKEACNCQATATIDRDTHIELALAKDAPPRQRVIVEVTPRVRDQMKAQDIDWTTETLTKATGKGIKGKWVEVTGWLLFDSMHIAEAENTNPGGAKNWRATCWEVHPVTGIRVLEGPPAGTPDFQSALMATLHRAHAQQLSRNPAKKEALESRNKQVLAKFNKDELDEDLP
jgi:hypothetical protein